MEFKICVVLTLLLATIGSAISAGCPSDEAIKPCICEEDDLDVDVTLACYGEDISQDKLRSILKAFDGESTLAIEFDSQILGTVPSNFFQGLKVKRLEIYNSQLDSLTEEGGEALSGLEDTLEELVITSSFSEDNVPAKLDISHLRSLKELDLSFNTITELGNDWFANGPLSLTRLIISNNGIEEMGDKAFANLINLERLWTDGNRFGPISRNMLPYPANKLEDLELDNNALTSVPEDFFSHMPALRSLSLRTNGFAKLPQRTFQPIWQQLNTIHLQGNPLECDTHIEWMFNMKKSPTILGECRFPTDKDGLSLQDLIQSKGQ